MVSKEIIDLVKNKKAQGYSEQQIRLYLTEKSYASQEIDEALAYSIQTPFPRISNKAILIAIPLIILTLIGYSCYMLNLEKFMDDQNTLVYGQNDFESGSKAALRIVTTNNKNSETITGASITIEAREKGTDNEILLFEGKTDESGSDNIEFDIPENLEGEYELIIKTGSEYGKNEIIKTVSIEKTYKILLTTDKPLYQPGQTINIRALTLKNSDNTPAKDREVTIEVEDSKGNKVFKKKITTSEYGIVSEQFTLADEINYGRYTIRATIDDYSAEKKVDVKKYVLPKFKVNIETDKSYYLPGQTLKGTIDAAYFYGKPANDAEVKIRIYTYEVNMEEIATIHGITDSEGIYSFEFMLPDHFIGLPLEKGSSLIFFNISVTDQAMHTEEITSSAPIAQNPINIELIPESGTLEEDLENIIYVMTTYPDGKPAPSTVTIDGKDIITNSYGLGEFRIIPGNYRTDIIARAQDSKGNKGSISTTFSTNYKTESVLLRVDKSILDVGDSVHLDAFCTSIMGTIYIDIIKDKQTILTKALDVTDGRAALDLDLDETMSGTLELHAYKILSNSNIIRDTRTIFVNENKDIELDITPDKDTYIPGEEAQITFQTTKNNAPIPTAIGVNIVDESVFALQEKESGFERLYFELEQELMEPRYTIYGITLPELICNPDPMIDNIVRVQAGNILMAEAPAVDDFTLKVSSIQETQKEIEQKKSEYFTTLAKTSTILLILIPISILVILIHNHKNEKKQLLKNSIKSIMLLIGMSIGIIAIIFATFMIGETASYKQQDTVYGIEVAIIAVILISSIITSLRSRKDLGQHFRKYYISTIMIPASIITIIMPLMQIISYRYDDILLLSIPVMILIAATYSIASLISYSAKNDKNLLKITLLFLAYIILIPVMIFAGLYSQSTNDPHILWLGITMLIIPITYGLYTIDFLRQKNKLAIPTTIIAIILSVLPIIFLFSIMSFEAKTGIMLEANMEIGMFDAIAQRAIDTNIYKDSPQTSGSTGEQPRVRQFFPETLYSNPQIITDNSGKATLSLDMADSITTWRISALANSLDGGIGSSNTGIIVFQDFFADIDLPVSLTQGDEVSIPVSVFNYLKKSQQIRIELQGEDWFEILDTSEKSINLGPNDIDVVYFRIKAKKLGDHKLTVYAYGSEKSDAISRIIEIIPDGEEYRISYSDRLEGTVEKTISIPQESIDDSEKIFVKIYPGIFSQVVEGLDSMLRMPQGCFEQTSSSTYPNLLILDYMKKSKQINPEIQFRAEQYIGTGYQRLVKFESNTKGGWTWFGPPEEPNLMLSAYGLMEFKDMSKVYEIDKDIIERTQEYVISQMNSDGSFEPEGKLHTTGLNIQSSKMTSTCFVAWSLAYSGYDKMDKTIDYIENNIDLENEDSYTLALCGNALASHEKKNSIPVLQELDKRAVKDSKTIYWKSTGNIDQYKTVMGGQGSMKDMETTSLAALAYMEAGYGGSDVNKILTYIVTQKDSHGSWSSTFATIMSLKSLISASINNNAVSDAGIQIFKGNELVDTLTINEDNSDVLQQVELTQYTTKGDNNIRIEMNGEGNLFYQIVGIYYIDWEKTELPDNDLITIELDYDKTKLKVDDIVTATANAVYHGEGYVDNAILDLGIPPGFTVVSDDLQKEVAKGTIEKFDITGRQIIIYIRYLDYKGINLEYRLKAKYPIKAKTIKSAAYDYYNPDIRDEVEPVEIEVTQ